VVTILLVVGVRMFPFPFLGDDITSFTTFSDSLDGNRSLLPGIDVSFDPNLEYPIGVFKVSSAINGLCSILLTLNCNFLPGVDTFGVDGTGLDLSQLKY
jgi:hypothetical protein